MAKLLLKYKTAVIRELQIDKTPITVGRKSDNDIVIDNMTVSGHHAKIVMVGNSYVVEDLKSTNGTFLNDQKIVSAALKHNDQIVIGHHSLVFIEPEVQKHLDTDSTVLMSQEKQQQILDQQKPETQAEEQILQKFAAKQAKAEPTAMLRVIEGKADEIEYILSKPMTYIGKSETAAIKIRGMFAPDIAALISKRVNVYFITAVKNGYPKLNGSALSGQMELKNDDLIEMAGIKFLFKLKEPDQNS